MNRYLSLDMGSKSNKIDDIVNWIENIIQTSSSYDHREACERLVTNFTENLLLFNQDYVNYKNIEVTLRRLITKKFENNNLCKH
jgi:hypothetical protein